MKPRVLKPAPYRPCDFLSPEDLCPKCGGFRPLGKQFCHRCAAKQASIPEPPLVQLTPKHPLWDKIAAAFILSLHLSAIITAAAYSILKLPEDTLLYLSSGILILWLFVNIFLVRVFILSENKQLPDYLYERAYFAPAILITAVLTCIWRTINTIIIGIIAGIHYLITKITALFRQH